MCYQIIYHPCIFILIIITTKKTLPGFVLDLFSDSSVEDYLREVENNLMYTEMMRNTRQAR